MNLTQVMEYIKGGYNITKSITVRLDDKEYSIGRVYLEDFSDGLYQIVLNIKEDK